MKVRLQFPCALEEAKSPYFSVIWGMRIINQRSFIPHHRGTDMLPSPHKVPNSPTYSPGFPPRGRRWQVHYRVARSTVATSTKFVISLWQPFWHLFDNFLVAFFATGRSKYMMLREAELTIVLKPTHDRGAWQLRLPQLSHFDWLVKAETITKLSKRCQKVVTEVVTN